MPKRVLVHEEALAEADEAFRWYSERSQSAADRFADEVTRAYDRIADQPRAHADYPYGPGKYVLLNRFPFVVVYVEHDDHIGVYAIAHTSREPGYWSERVSD